MRRYTSGDRGYQAITEAMQQIRYGHLHESEEEEMMDEMSDEEEEAVAQMMDEALYEMDMEDDEDNLNEADGGRKARRRRRLRQALLIGAGLAAAAGGIGAAYKRGKAMNPASDIRRQAGYDVGLRGAIQDIGTGAGAYGSDVLGAISKRFGRN